MAGIIPTCERMVLIGRATLGSTASYSNYKKSLVGSSGNIDLSSYSNVPNLGGANSLFHPKTMVGLSKDRVSILLTGVMMLSDSAAAFGIRPSVVSLDSGHYTILYDAPLT
jgi:hypothetical protein